MRTMTYKGYTAEIIYSDEDDCFVGSHGDTNEELRDAFENMVELYIDTLEAPENPPQKHNADGFWARLREVFHL